MVRYALAVEIDVAVAHGHHTHIGVGAEYVDLTAVGNKCRLVADHADVGTLQNIDTDDHVIGIDFEPFRRVVIDTGVRLVGDIVARHMGGDGGAIVRLGPQ